MTTDPPVLWRNDGVEAGDGDAAARALPQVRADTHLPSGAVRSKGPVEWCGAGLANPELAKQEG